MKQVKYIIPVMIFLLATIIVCFSMSPILTAHAGKHVDAADKIESDQRILPILMYHKILNSRSNDYIVSEKILENDLAELKKRGYTTVFPSEVIAFADGKTELPQKPIMLTFDDGHYNNVFYGQNILQRNGAKAVLNIIGTYTDKFSNSDDHSKPAYSHLTWEQIREANDSGCFEIGNHTFDMHRESPRKGVTQKFGESDNEYKKALTEDITKMQQILQEKCEIQSTCFAYPFGKFSDYTEEIILEMGFRMIFTCYEQQNLISAGAPHELSRLCRFNRNPKLTSSGFFDKMENSRIKRYVK